MADKESYLRDTTKLCKRCAEFHPTYWTCDEVNAHLTGTTQDEYDQRVLELSIAAAEEYAAARAVAGWPVRLPLCRECAEFHTDELTCDEVLEYLLFGDSPSWT